MYLRLCRFLFSAIAASLPLGECSIDPFHIEDTLPRIDIRSQCAALYSTIDAVCTCISENEADYQYIVHNWQQFSPDHQKYCAGYTRGCLDLGRPITYERVKSCLDTGSPDAPRLSRWTAAPEKHAGATTRSQSRATHISL